MSRPLAERFWAKINKTGSCWLWTGMLSGVGYGIFVNGKGEDQIAWLAHRLAWELTNGPIPDGKHLCHRCDVRACVRPDHLFVGTPTDNMQDAVAKGRISRGERVHLSKLTADKVRFIRSNPHIPSAILAKQFGVSRVAINFVRSRHTWKHV